MGKLTLSGKQKFADAIGGLGSNNDLNYFRFGTSNAVAEDESNTVMSAPTSSGDKIADLRKRVNKSQIISAFWPAGTFLNSEVLRELGVKFSDGSTLGVRDTTNQAWPISNPDTYDIRVDVTIAVEQA